MNRPIGISLGDFAGIGPEVTLKALAAEAGADQTRYLLVGDADHTLRLNRALGLNLPLERSEKGGSSRFQIHDPLELPLPAQLTPGSPAAARAALSFLTCGAQRCLQHELLALVTAPVNKQSIIRSGEPFVGQTEYLSGLSGTPGTAMMLLGNDSSGKWLRVVLVTTHLPLKMVAAHLSPEKIERAIRLAGKACRDLGLPRSRIGVCGLNPHAGEGGEMGEEELTMIQPVLEKLRGPELDLHGPLPADTLFYHAFRGDYDVVVAMYHDQGLAPLKMVAFENGVNWTLGLPFVRTSPDHGTAYDIAGRGVASPSSMLAAIRLAKKLAAQA